MFYWLSQFSDAFGPLNVFRYITFRTGGAMFTGIVFVFVLGPRMIASLRLKQGAPIHSDGLVILSSLIVATVLWANPGTAYVWIVLGVTFGFGLVGLCDDCCRVMRQTHAGFSGRTRLLLEFAIAGAACYLIMLQSTSLAFPFFKELPIDFSWFFIPFAAVVVVGAGNAVNLVDGPGGLAIAPVMIAAACFGALSWVVGNAVFADYMQVNFVANSGELAVLCGAILGAGIGLLLFNAPATSIFMGDTGSLALGGLLGTVAVITKG
jgi:phospho-N-acetylmuramoyl-pentapeptide-transferase